MHIVIVSAAVISTFTMDGAIEDDGSDYAIIDIEVPEGVREIEVAHASGASDDVLDWGLWDPGGFRGWGGGLTENAIVGESEASRGYLPGPMTPGIWQLVIGKAQIRTWPAPYGVTVTLRDEETLPPRPRAEYAPVVLETGERWYRGDFHVHSRESGDAAATFEDIAALVRERGLDFVALSDHNTVSHHALMAAFQAGEGEVLFLRSAEITTYGGHGNAFGISRYIDHRVGYQGRSAAAIAADVAAQGGLFSINHPALDLGDLCIGCPWDDRDMDWGDVHAIEIHTGNYDLASSLFTPQSIELWDSILDQGYRVTAIAGSDDHRAGIDLDPFQSPIGSPTTLVFATELSESAILEAVRQGRVIVQLRGPDDPLVELAATGDVGGRAAIGGTTSGSAVELEVRVRGAGGQGLSLLVVRDGEPLDLVAIDADDWTRTFAYDVDASGDRFRVHVVRGDLAVVVTNHIYVDHVAPAAPADSGCGCGAGRSQAPGVFMLVVLACLTMRYRGRPRRPAASRVPKR